MGGSLNILVTGAGAPGFPGIVKALRTNGERKVRIVATDAKPDVVGFYLAEKHYKVPMGNDKGYVKAILEIAEKEGIDVVLPLCTLELLPLAKNRKVFEEKGVKIVVSDEKPLETALNKAALFDFFKDKYSPRFFKVRNLRAFERGCEKLGYPDKPVVFKPAVSYGSRGFRIIMKSNKVERFFKEKPSSLYAEYDEIVKILSQSPFPESLVVEYLPGEEYSVDLLVGKDVIYSIPRKRVVIKQGISNVGIIEKNEELINISSDIARKLKLKFNINMQFRQDENRKFKLIEINPRVSGSIIFCVGAGVNLPYYGVKLVLGEKITKTDIRWNTRIYRYWNEIFVYNDKKYNY